jgi:O-antigen ligase
LSKALAWRFLVPALLLLAGSFFSWRLLSIPSRVETTAFMIAFFLLPTLKYPKFGVYYLFCMPFFIPLFRRMYYLIEERPAIDYLMLISDGVMGGFICALTLLWLLNKEKVRDPFPVLVIAYTCLIFVKIFVGNDLDATSAFYGFKFHGLYVMFFFAGSYIITTAGQTRRLLGFTSWILLLTAGYAVKQILFGFSGFERKWMDSITFTTLYIEGVVRPFSTYLSPATLADGMVIMILTGAYWFIAKGRHTALFGLVLVAAAVWPLLIATVRTNWLAAIAGLFFYVVWLRIRKGWAKVALMAVVLSAMVGGALRSGGGSAQFQSAAIQGQLSSGSRSVSEIMIKNRTRALANPLQEYSVQKRMQTWGFIWQQTLHRPLGVGTGTTGYAHSFYLQTLGETGFPGLALFLAMLWLTFLRGFRVAARSRDPATAELARYLLTLVFVLSILNLTGTHLHTPPGDLFFWFALGTLHRFHRNLVEEEGAAAAATAAERAAADERGTAAERAEAAERVGETAGPAAGAAAPAGGSVAAAEA